jgi:hypothetical protein
MPLGGAVIAGAIALYGMKQQEEQQKAAGGAAALKSTQEATREASKGLMSSSTSQQQQLGSNRPQLAGQIASLSGADPSTFGQFSTKLDPISSDVPAPGAHSRAAFAQTRESSDTKGQFNASPSGPGDQLASRRFSEVMGPGGPPPTTTPQYGPQAEPLAEAAQAAFRSQNDINTAGPQDVASTGGFDAGTAASLATAGAQAGMQMRKGPPGAGIPNPGQIPRYDSSQYMGQARPIGRF